jgi:hypothetical protein
MVKQWVSRTGSQKMNVMYGSYGTPEVLTMQLRKFSKKDIGIPVVNYRFLKKTNKQALLHFANVGEDRVVIVAFGIRLIVAEFITVNLQRRNNPHTLYYGKTGLSVVGTSVVGTSVVGATVGMKVGTSVGMKAGMRVGASVGMKVGAPVGMKVGAPVGMKVGASVGMKVGVLVGMKVGFLVGNLVLGLTEGFRVGAAVGRNVGNRDVGAAVGTCDVRNVGAVEGFVGTAEGEYLGTAVGNPFGTLQRL